MSLPDINIEAVLQNESLNTPLIKAALAQAFKSHSEQRRFDGQTVYEGHILPVARMVIESYEGNPVPEIAVAGALLHDTVEDDPSYSEEQLRTDFPPEVADTVMNLTKSPEENEHKVWGEEFFTATQRILAKLETAPQVTRNIKLADRCVNFMTIDDFRESRPEDFERFVSDTEMYFLPFAEKYSPFFYKKIKAKLESLGR